MAPVQLNTTSTIRAACNGRERYLIWLSAATEAAPNIRQVLLRQHGTLQKAFLVLVPWVCSNQGCEESRGDFGHQRMAAGFSCSTRMSYSGDRYTGWNMTCIHAGETWVDVWGQVLEIYDSNQEHVIWRKTDEGLGMRSPAPPCVVCGDVNEYAQANLPGGKFACYSCRTTRAYMLPKPPGLARSLVDLL